MKYWTGYITAAVIGAITWALMRLAEQFGTLVDMVYPYVSRTLMDMLTQWSSSVDYCLWQMAVVAFVVIVAASIVVLIVMKWNPIRWLGWVLAVCSVVYLLNTLTFGLNYYAGSIAEDIRMETRDYSLEELADAAEYYRDKANELAVQVKRDSKGDVAFDDFETLALQAGNGFDHLVRDRLFPVFAGSTQPVKELGWANMYTSMGITGFTLGITGEAAVNPQIPDVTLPFTMAHEMSHRMSIANERDANFAAFLACAYNEDIQYQYSAYFMAYRYCYNALASIGIAETAVLTGRVAVGVSEELQHDMDAYSAFFKSKKDEKATKFADTVNDTYLKTSGDTAGVASYGAVCDLLVNWHYQEVVLPALIVEEEPFDPFDEMQVDLSGNANANIVAATEPETETEGGEG